MKLNYFKQSDYYKNQDIYDIVLEELLNLKRERCVDSYKDENDLFVDKYGHVYCAETYPVWVEIIDIHGRHEEITYEPDMENAVLVITNNNIKELV
jgi:hypothetical protein